MASFTDRIEQFTPYRPEFPVEAALMVGMEKEAQFTKGIQQIQGEVDKLKGFDIMKPETRQYLEGKMSEMRGAINSVSGDFSDQRLVNGIDALSGRIGSDPVVQNGIMSTMNFRKGAAEIEKARQEGKGSPENEWDFQSEAMKWLNDRDYTSQFSHKYTPYVDVRKKVMDVIKTLDPNTLLDQNPFITDSKGNIMVDESTGQPVLNYDIIEKHYKGKDADRISNAIMASLDGNDLKQLDISGRYTYKDVPPEVLQEDIADHYKNQKLSIVNAIAELSVDRLINQGDSETQKAIDEKVKGYENQLKLVDEAYKGDVTVLGTNPEAVKGKLYRNSFINSISSAFSSEERWTKYLDNPAFNNFMEAERYKLDKWWKEEDLKFKYFQEQNSLLKASISESKKKTAKGEANDYSYEGTPYPVGTNIPTPTEFSFRDETNKIEDKKYETMEDIVKTYAGPAYENWQKTSILAANTADANGVVSGKPLNKRVFLEAQYRKLKDAWNEKKEIPQPVEEQIADIAAIDKEVETRHKALYTVKNEADKQFPAVVGKNLTEGITSFKMNTMSGKDITFEPDDFIDFAIYMDESKLFQTKEGKERYKQAENKLISKFGKENLDEIYNAEIQSSGATGRFSENLKRAKDAIASSDFTGRRDYISNELTNRGLVGKPVQYGLIAESDADRNRIKTLLTNYADEAKTTGTNENPDFSRDELMTALSSTKGFTANMVRVPSISKFGNDLYEVTINDLGKNKQSKMTITQDQAEQLSGRDFTSGLSKIEDRIRFSGNGTTNYESPALGSQSHAGAFLDRRDFPNVSVPIKADVAQSKAEKGKYFVTIYTQNANKEWVAKEAKLTDASGKPVRTALTIEQLEAFLANLDDTTINYLFK